ncbi:hypothetical protein [Microbulbifer epialgicus]|uniref:Uncharacterized protein n=1 Tax=Microbulbifer epialgicus TaxID=393907 RepID=A0ABV4NTL9_9GAMM
MAGNQIAGYLTINGEKLLVLARRSGWKRYFKLRVTGADGVFFEDESGYIQDLENTHGGYVTDLKAGLTLQIE